MKNKHLLLALVFLFSLTFISAQPPLQPQEFGEINIEYSKLTVFPQGQDIHFHFHTSNATQYLSNESIDCVFSLINSSGFPVIQEQPLTFHVGTDNEWGITILDGNFTNGFYSYATECNSSIQTGLISNSIEITPSGTSGSDNIFFYIIIIILGYTLNLLGFFNRNSTITILGGFVLLFVGLFMIQNGLIYRNNLTLVISYVTLFWGLGSSLWAAVEQIQDEF